MLPEKGDEVAWGTEAECFGDFADHRAGAQHLFGIGQAAGDDIRIQRHAGFGLENPVELALSHSRQPDEILLVDRSVDAILDQHADIFDQFRAGRGRGTGGLRRPVRPRQKAAQQLKDASVKQKLRDFPVDPPAGRHAVVQSGQTGADSGGRRQRKAALANPLRQCGEQLRRLRTDHIDYYLMHNITSPAQWERVVALGIEDWIARQKAAGRIRQIGFSYHGSAADFLTMLDAYDWDFCQIQYNYAGERYQAGTAGLMAAAERGLAVFVMEPLLGGRLAGKLSPRARAVLDDVLDPYLKTPAAWGLSWVWNHPQVTMLLSGMTDTAQVDENAALADRALPNSMTREQLDTIARVLGEFEKSNRVPCTGCGYCMPCPKGINIPGCFAAYNASYAHSWFTGLSQYFTASAVRTNEPKLVSNCAKCGKCARHCPQHIDIPERLDDVRRRFQPGPVTAALKAFCKTRSS